MALGVTVDADELDARLADPVRRTEVETAIAGQATHFDLLGLQLGHVYDGPLVVDDGTPPIVLDEPARDYEPSTRPGGRLPHGWIDADTSTLDLVDPTVLTVLVRDGADAPVPPPEIPTQVRTIDADVWDHTFELAPDRCLIVRPDQHIVARCSTVDVGDVIEQLLTTATTEVT